MAKKKKPETKPPVRRSNEVTVEEESLIALADAFEAMSSGQAARLTAWLEEYGMTEEDFDAHLKHLGEVMGRDMGIL